MISIRVVHAPSEGLLAMVAALNILVFLSPSLSSLSSFMSTFAQTHDHNCMCIYICMYVYNYTLIVIKIHWVVMTCTNSFQHFCTQAIAQDPLVSEPLDRWEIPDGNDLTGQTCHILYMYVWVHIFTKDLFRISRYINIYIHIYMGKPLENRRTKNTDCRIYHKICYSLRVIFNILNRLV